MGWLRVGKRWKGYGGKRGRVNAWGEREKG